MMRLVIWDVIMTSLQCHDVCCIALITKKYISMLNHFPRYGSDAGSLNPSPCKTRHSLSYVDNVIVAGDLATHGAMHRIISHGSDSAV